MKPLSPTQQHRDLSTLYLCGVIFGFATALGTGMTLIAIEAPDGFKYQAYAGFCLCVMIFCVIAIKGAFGDLMRHMTRAERVIEFKAWEVDELQKSHEYLLARSQNSARPAAGVERGTFAPAAGNLIDWIDWPVNSRKH